MNNQSARFLRVLFLCALAAVSVCAPLAASNPVWILDPTFKLNQLPPQRLPANFVFYSVINPVTSVAVQADGKIIVAGDFVSDTGAYRGFTRLLPNGEIDADFQPGRSVASVNAVAVNSRQNIYTVNRADDTSESIAQY